MLHLLEGLGQTIDFFARVVEIEAGPGGGVDLESLVKRHGTVMAGTDGYAVAVEQLGDKRFSVREEASRFLWRQGLKAQPALERAAASGKPALDYLHDRGFTDETIETFRLGWAPDAWDAMNTAVRRKRQVNEHDLEAAGLISRRRSGRFVMKAHRKTGRRK